MAIVLQPGAHFRSQQDFRREIDDIFSHSLGAALHASLVPAFPPVESFLDGEEYVIRIDLPGIDPKEIEVNVTNDIVSIQGSRQHHGKQEKLDFVHCEVAHGDFERSVRLPKGIRTEDIKARYNHGVLELRMPVPKGAAARRVPIKVETASARNS
jgi:HSP20 family protein